MTETHADAAIIDPPHPTSSLLSGSVGRQIFWLALPVLAEQLLNYTVGLTDAFLSGRISKEATAAVGIGAYVNWLVEILFAVVGCWVETCLTSRIWVNEPVEMQLTSSY